jgi:hypothetical protein
MWHNYANYLPCEHGNYGSGVIDRFPVQSISFVAFFQQLIDGDFFPMTKMTTDHRDTKVFDKVFDSSNQASLIPTHSGLDQPLHLGRNTASHTALDPTDRLQDFQNKLTAGIQHATKQTGLSELSQEFDRAANIVDEYYRQTLEAGEQVISGAQNNAIQGIDQTKQRIIKHAESFVTQHPELTDRLDGFKQQISEVTDQVTESLSHQVKSTAKESLLAVYRGMKKAYDISDRFTQEFPAEWQHLKEVLAERTLQAREAVVQPIIGVIDAGFGENEHGNKIVKTITQKNHEANIVEKTGVGNGGWSRSLTEFVDGVKASGKDGIANLSFDLIQKNADGQVSTRHQLTGQEYQALAYAEQNGVLVVAAAGNDGQTSSWGEASELFNNLVVVGATEGDQQAQYSAGGRGLDLLAAGQTDQGTGTSFAAAQVSAIAAEMWTKTPVLTASQLEDLLKTSNYSALKYKVDFSSMRPSFARV